jgi:putative phage-type endonuclease
MLPLTNKEQEMKKHTCVFHQGEQGSPEWFLARLGKVTASRFGDVMTKGRGGKASKTSESYMAELISERLTGENKFFVSPAVSWGSDHEDDARDCYMWRTSNTVKKVGFATIGERPMIGASSDGLVDEEGIVEIKCPYTSSNHVKTILSKEVPSEYVYQVQGQMWVLNKQWCDFVSYDPRMPETHRMIVIRVERDDEKIEALAERLDLFCERMEEMTLDVDKNACDSVLEKK